MKPISEQEKEQLALIHLKWRFFLKFVMFIEIRRVRESLNFANVTKITNLEDLNPTGQKKKDLNPKHYRACQKKKKSYLENFIK